MKTEITAETIKFELQKRFGVYNGYLTKAAKELDVNYTQLCSVVAGRLKPPQPLLAKLKLIPDLPHLPYGSTEEYVVVTIPEDTVYLLRELRTDPRFIAKEKDALALALHNGLIGVREYLKTKPFPDDDQFARYKKEATAPVPEGNPDLEDEDRVPEDIFGQHVDPLS